MTEISTLAVLGSGTMGRGIAHVAALAGYRTHLFDVSRKMLDQAESTIHKNLDKGVALGKVDPHAAAQARTGLTVHTELGEAVANADLVIEAIPEEMVLKVETFAAVAALSPAHTLFASNTSALSITEMAAASGRPERFAGMHFFNPVHVMKLLELVRGLQTSDETLAAMHAVGERMGKEVVVVREAPGFVTTRINAMIGNEAFRMLEEGVASAPDIDRALKLGLNHPMGPFELGDLVGLDVRLKILEFLHQSLGERFRPNNLLVQHVRAGRLGRKSGRGVYEYDADGKKKE